MGDDMSLGLPRDAGGKKLGQRESPDLLAAEVEQATAPPPLAYSNSLLSPQRLSTETKVPFGIGT